MIATHPVPAASSRASASRNALAVFVGLEIVAVPLVLWWGRNQWFSNDDWDFLTKRSVGNVGDLFRPHFQHWVTLPFVAYRFLWWAVGLRSYAPYQLLVIVAHLAVAALLRAVMRRAGVGPWVATGFAGLFVFFGSGAENIVLAFQVTFVAALAFGLAHLLLSDHDGPVDRRDWLGLAAGLAGLLCSGVALTMLVVVGLTMLLRRGWRIALLHTAPLAAIYLIWSQAAPTGQTTDEYRAHSFGEVIRFVAIGAQAAFGGFAARGGAGIAFALILAAGLGLLAYRERLGVLRGPAAASIALLVGAIGFLFVTALFRSGQEGFLRLFTGTGPDRARQSRYVYIVAAMALPSVALAANALIRYQRRLAIAIAVLLAIGLVGNAARLRDFRMSHASRTLVTSAPRLPIARQLPRSVEVTEGLSLGWLLDNLSSGRIPEPPELSPGDIATETLGLALARSRTPGSPPCETLREPSFRELAAGQSLTLLRGNADVAYVPIDGAASRRVAVPSGTTLTALVGPFRIAIAPVSDAIIVCTGSLTR